MLQPLRLEKSSMNSHYKSLTEYKLVFFFSSSSCWISWAPSCLYLFLHSNVQDQINGPNTSEVISSWIVCKIACGAYIHHNIVLCSQFMCATLQSKMTTKSLFVHSGVCLLRISTHEELAQMIAYLLICSLDLFWLLISIFFLFFFFFKILSWYTTLILSSELNKSTLYSFGNKKKKKRKNLYISKCLWSVEDQRRHKVQRGFASISLYLYGP